MLAGRFKKESLGLRIPSVAGLLLVLLSDTKFHKCPNFVNNCQLFAWKAWGACVYSCLDNNKFGYRVEGLSKPSLYHLLRVSCRILLS